MDDPFARKVYLRPLPSGALNARYSAGSQRRAAQLSSFLGGLQTVAARELPLAGRPELLVLGSEDWRRLSSQPYGLPLARAARRPGILAAAAYPERLLHRFDEALLRAGQQGLKPPGELREYLDLLIGLEWGHAVLALGGLRSRSPWLDELNATCALLLALEGAEHHAVRARLLAWAALGAAGSAQEALPLGDFAHPRSRMRLGPMLWFQGRFAAFAETLTKARGWGYLLALRELNEAGGLRRGLEAPLVLLEPAFEPWLADFAAE